LSQTVKALLKLSDRLFAQKAAFDRLNQDIADLFFPERATFTRQHCIGEDLAAHLFDSYTVRARRDLGNAFSAMLRPRGQDWFSIRAVGVDHLSAHGRTWLEGSAGVMRRVFYDARTRFVRAMKETDHDYAAFGNGVLTCEPTHDRDSLIYRNWHLANVAWSEDEHGFPSPVVRKDRMTARQLARHPGNELPQRVRDCAEDADREDTEFDVLHVVMPSEQWQNYSDRKLRQPWASAYVLKEPEGLLRVEGVRSKRYVIPRWQTLSGSPYALSPATIVALPDARMIQKLAMILMEAGEKRIDPPTIATKGAVLSDVNIFAGGTTWVDKVYDERLGPALRTLDLGGDPGFGEAMLANVRSAIADAFYLNKLTLPQTGKTAYETARLVEEYIRAAIPLFEPLETEYTQPVLDASFAELMALGAFGPPDDVPEELRGADVEFQFSNPLQEAIEAQKATKMQGLGALLGVAAQMEQAQQLQSGRQINVIEMFRDAGMATTPASWWNDPDDAADDVATQPDMADQLSQVVAAAGGVKQVADAASSTARAAEALQGAFGAEGPTDQAGSPEPAYTSSKARLDGNASLL